MILWILLLLLINHPTGHLWPPCPTEDSVNCIWIATDAGNGQGRSFININDTLYYFDGEVRQGR